MQTHLAVSGCSNMSSIGLRIRLMSPRCTACVNQVSAKDFAVLPSSFRLSSNTNMDLEEKIAFIISF